MDSKTNESFEILPGEIINTYARCNLDGEYQGLYFVQQRNVIAEIHLEEYEVDRCVFYNDVEGKKDMFFFMDKSSFRTSYRIFIGDPE